jgi:hypothetical protein
VLQLENHALTRGELVQSTIDAAAKFPAHQIALRIRAGASVGYLVEHVILLALSVYGDRSIFFAHLALAKMIEAEIGHNAVNPGVKGTFKTEVPDVPVGFQERFLVNILGFVVGSSEVHCQPQHSLIVVPHQFFKGGAISALRLAN